MDYITGRSLHGTVLLPWMRFLFVSPSKDIFGLCSWTVYSFSSFSRFLYRGSAFPVRFVSAFRFCRSSSLPSFSLFYYMRILFYTFVILRFVRFRLSLVSFARFVSFLRLVSYAIPVICLVSVLRFLYAAFFMVGMVRGVLRFVADLLGCPTGTAAIYLPPQNAFNLDIAERFGLRTAR